MAKKLSVRGSVRARSRRGDAPRKPAKTARDEGARQRPAPPGGSPAAGGPVSPPFRAGGPAARPSPGSPLGEPFPVVGIGSSAGGLEALEQFLRSVPKGSGLAYVIVQHLDPHDRGTFVDILRRATAMPVEQVQDGARVKPDHVYVIPPGKDMSLLRGALHLLPQGQPRGLNLPADFFFRTLAEDLHERAIAVVLSGMGSDGSLGLRAIKEKGGATFVQALASAKFDSMPRSAIEAGLADVVEPPGGLPARILAYARRAPRAVAEEPTLGERQERELAKVFVLLRDQTGNDFSLYKRTTVHRRIERRMGLHQIDDLARYVRFLRENPKELDLLFRELLIGVTSFFRDPPVWEQLQGRVGPALLAARPQGGTIRAWVPGCSTGEEAYSLAMVLREVLSQHQELSDLGIQIFATDLDAEAVEKARNGLYPANIAADVSAERLRQFFVQDERGFRVGKAIRECVVFAPQNLIMDPPFTKLDLLSCRNLLIYLAPEVQRKIIPMFHYALNPGGLLLLGSSETIGAYGSLFSPLDGKTRLYGRLEQSAAAMELFSAYRPPAAVEPPPPSEELPAHAARESLQALTERAILQRLAPTAVLTDDRGDILYLSGKAGKYLEPSAGRAHMNVFAMAREGLRYELSAAFSAALKGDRAVTTRGLRLEADPESCPIDVSVQRLGAPPGLRGTVLIAFTDVPEAAPGAHPGGRRAPRSSRAAALTIEVQRAREELQSTREEMQTSQEELKSMNEELQSTNEELQSTNEELTTSKEEMQSMNEELQTVNHELQSKVDELSRSNNDMKNLLNSTDIATLFLDGELLIRRFTTQTSRLIKLIPADTGRPITDLTSVLDYPDLPDDAREVLRTLVFKERQVATRDGRWFSVRILPYRTIDNVIDGVVITFSDVTATKGLEARLRIEAGELQAMADSLPVMVWGARADGACDHLSRRWSEFTGSPEQDGVGHGWLNPVHPDDRERVRQAWDTAVQTGAALDAELRLRDRTGAYRWFLTRAVPVRNDAGAAVRWYGTCTDIDALRRRCAPEAEPATTPAGEGANA